MPTCRTCQDEVDKLLSIKIAGKAVRMCADCADRAREEAEIAEAGEAAMRSMMGYKGRR
ncbi:MAG: hypothetical protein R2939_02795 [Kofleriaceae bacterium]